MAAATALPASIAATVRLLPAVCATRPAVTLPPILAAATAPETTPTASGVKWKSSLRTTGARLSSIPIAATSSRSGSWSAKPRRGGGRRRGCGECRARRCGDEQQVAGGDRREPGHDPAFSATQPEGKQGAERKGDRVSGEQRPCEERAAMLGENEQRQGDGEVRVRDPRAE